MLWDVVNSQRLGHATQLLLSLPVSFPPVAGIAFADEIHASGLRAMENLAETLLIAKQASKVVIDARRIRDLSHGGLLILRQIRR